MPTIKDCYDALRKEIEITQGITVGKLTLTDDNGIVEIKVIPKLQELRFSFTDAGTVEPTEPPIEEEPPVEEPPAEEEPTIITTPTEDGVIISWGTDGNVGTGDMVILSVTGYNVYRSAGLDPYERIAENVTGTSYTDSPLVGNTYTYYIARVNSDGTEGIKSKEISITI